MAKKTLTLPDYIRQIGNKEFMARYGAKKRATEAYRGGWRRPRPDSPVAKKLLRESPLTFEGIYGS